MPSPEPNPSSKEKTMTADELFEEIEKGRVKRTGKARMPLPTRNEVVDAGEAERSFRLDPVFGS